MVMPWAAAALSAAGKGHIPTPEQMPTQPYQCSACSLIQGVQRKPSSSQPAACSLGGLAGPNRAGCAVRHHIWYAPKRLDAPMRGGTCPHAHIYTKAAKAKKWHCGTPLLH